MWQKKVDILEKKNKKLNRTIAMLTAKDDDSDDDSTTPEVPVKRARLEEDLRLSESPTPTRSSDSVPSSAIAAKQSATPPPSKPSIMLPRRPSSTSAATSHTSVQQQLQSQTPPLQQSPARQVHTPPSQSQAQGASPSQIQRQGATGSPQAALTNPPQQFEMEMYEALVEALELAKTQKTPQELKGKYTELLNNLLTNTPYTREQIMPVLNRAFEHVVPGIIPASVPTISLPDLITPGAASAIMPPNRTVVPSPSYQVPAHSLRMQNAQGYQQRLRPPLPGQIQVQVVQGSYMRHFTPRQPQPPQQRRRDS